MKRGLYRTIDPMLGVVARVHDSAGDAAPYLPPQIYALLEFRPAFDRLPSEREYRRTPGFQARYLSNATTFGQTAEIKKRPGHC